MGVLVAMNVYVIRNSKIKLDRSLFSAIALSHYPLLQRAIVSSTGHQNQVDSRGYPINADLLHLSGIVLDSSIISQL